ncbi:MAG: acyl-CoA/acyl-ACP dehydrogenase [bacterium]|nr:acyl-CoA/acyl-ACP dehydrogenase [bacterium]MCP5067137.1 acyl-CoA/acyl-ACP dehydrogenase [bacterium]
MDFSHSEDQEALRGLAREILSDQLSQDRLRAVTASEDRIDRELWAELAKANLLGLTISDEHGGSGFGLAELALLQQEIGRTVAPVPAYPTLVLGALAIDEFGSDELRAVWLPRVASGDAMLSAATAQVAGDGVTARHDGTGWRLEGRCSLVPAGHVAQRILVPAATEEGELSVFLVDSRCEGAQLDRVETTDDQLRPHLHLKSVRVPDAELLGEPGSGAKIMEWIHERAILSLCATQLGVAERALDMTAAYTTERQQFNRPIGSFQAVHQRAADAHVQLQAMKVTLWRAIHLLSRNEDVSEILPIAKYWASVGGAFVTFAAQHLHGGIGVDLDYPLHRYYLWARQIGLHLGTGTAQLARLGERIACKES